MGVQLSAVGTTRPVQRGPVQLGVCPTGAGTLKARIVPTGDSGWQPLATVGDYAGFQCARHFLTIDNKTWNDIGCRYHILRHHLHSCGCLPCGSLTGIRRKARSLAYAGCLVSFEAFACCHRNDRLAKLHDEPLTEKNDVQRRQVDEKRCGPQLVEL